MVTPRNETERAVFEVWKELRPDEAFVLGLDECAGGLFMPPHGRPDGPRYASARSARVQRPQRYPESRGERAPRQRCAGGDPVAYCRQRAIRQGIRPARIRPRGNVRRDVRAVQANRMWTRPIPLV